MAQNEEKMQADQAAFGAHYIDDTIHADKSSRTAAFIKKFLQRKSSPWTCDHSLFRSRCDRWTINRSI